MRSEQQVSTEAAGRLNYPYPPYDEKISGYVVRQKAKYRTVDSPDSM